MQIAVTQSKPTSERKRTGMRANSSVISAAMKALVDGGYTVDNVCIIGGRIEIGVTRVERPKEIQNHGRKEPKSWE